MGWKDWLPWNAWQSGYDEGYKASSDVGGWSPAPEKTDGIYSQRSKHDWQFADPDSNAIILSRDLRRGKARQGREHDDRTMSFLRETNDAASGKGYEDHADRGGFSPYPLLPWPGQDPNDPRNPR